MRNKEYEFGAYKEKRRAKMGPGPRMGGEKAKNTKKTMIDLLNYAKKYRIGFIIAFSLAILGSVLTLLGPSFLTKLTDLITEGIKNSISQNSGMDMDKIFNIGITLSIIYVISYIFSSFKGVILATIMQTTAKNLRKELTDKINVLPMGFFYKMSNGEVLSRITNDVDTMGQSLSQSVGNLIASITLLGGSVVMMFITNGILALTALLSAALGFVFMRITVSKSQKHFKEQQKYLGEINGHIEEMYAGHTVVKAYNAEYEAVERFNQINKNLKGAAFKAQALSGLMMPIMTFIGNFGYVCVCIVGALLALNGSIGFGIIVAFMVYIRLFTQPLGQIAQAAQNMQSGLAAAERVFAFLKEEEMEDESEKTDTITNCVGNVTFERVHFGYNPEKPIIHDFSADIKAGQKVAIVGPTGAGKTTLVNLLMRFYDVQTGDIKIDGKSIYDISREEVHEQFAMVLQDTWLFEGTLKENLVYSSENISEDDLVKACKAVGLHRFVNTLPKGYNTLLNDKLQLSQGQKQQITIARAMLSEKPMIILDEATSSIDTRTELKIQKAMDELTENRTSFVIAHRLSTIKNADLILVMKDGNVIEKGNHDELLKQNGFYAGLYRSQFESD